MSNNNKFLPIQCKDSESSLTDSPGERPLDRVDGLVQVVAVQTQAGFQAEGVAGTQTCGLHLRVLKQGTRVVGGVFVLVVVVVLIIIIVVVVKNKHTV